MADPKVDTAAMAAVLRLDGESMVATHLMEDTADPLVIHQLLHMDTETLLHRN